MNNSRKSLKHFLDLVKMTTALYWSKHKECCCGRTTFSSFKADYPTLYIISNRLLCSTLPNMWVGNKNLFALTTCQALRHHSSKSQQSPSNTSYTVCKCQIHLSHVTQHQILLKYHLHKKKPSKNICNSQCKRSTEVRQLALYKCKLLQNLLAATNTDTDDIKAKAR